MEALWLVALPLGLRLREAVAVPVDAVDLDAGTLRVAWSIARTERQWVHKATKTHADETLALPRFAVDALRRRLEVRALDRMMAGPLWQEAAVVDERLRPKTVDLLFSREDGQPLPESRVYSGLANVCERAGVPRLTPHELRHSCVSILIALGVDLPTIQRLVRHRSQRLTSDLYGHLVQAVSRDAADRFDRLAEGDSGT